MLLLVFHIGSDRYAIDAAQLVEILPLLEVMTIPGAPSGVAGVCNYRGTAVPVLDLGDLAHQRPAAKLLSTRMLLVRRTCGPQEDSMLALIVEGATETLRRTPEQFVSAGVAVDRARWLGAVTPLDQGFLQLVDINALLPPIERSSLHELRETV